MEAKLSKGLLDLESLVFGEQSLTFAKELFLKLPFSPISWGSKFLCQTSALELWIVIAAADVRWMRKSDVYNPVLGGWH